MSASHYVEVAQVYTEALRNKVNPTTAVKDHFVVSKGQAAKWVYRCRRPPLNLLDATGRGRAAGDLTEKALTRLVGERSKA